ncbi:HAD-like domain-containing protein [Hyaloraphidium curvatum]|nr:HAD-like domain-containing protein [Hyaloraphidium curvatum]
MATKTGTKLGSGDGDLKANLLRDIDTFVFDCDGVLWSSDTPLRGAKEFLNLLAENNKRIIYVSNNSSKSRKSYLAKFKKLGFPADEDSIFSSAYAAAYYVKHVAKLPEDKKVYVVGMDGICAELESFGVSWIGSHQDNGKSADDVHEIQPDPSIGAVLLGFDGFINYYKLARAFCYIETNPHTLFLATNADSTYPLAGALFPGTGSLLSVLTTSLGRQPDAVLGKPSQNMLDTIIRRFHLDPHRTCMVGDRLDTDILFGKLGGLRTVLCLTGVTRAHEWETHEIQADYVVDAIGDLLP